MKTVRKSGSFYPETILPGNPETYLYLQLN